MFALDRSSRALLAGAAFVAFAGAFVTTPLGARGAAGFAATGVPRALPLAAPTGFAAVAPRRDPFDVPPPPPAAVRAGTPDAAPAAMPPLPGVPALSGIPAGLGPLPANAGAANAPLPFAPQSARVTAVVTGRHPFALVDEAGTTRLVTLGDRVAGDTVAAITADGVRFTRGTALPVAPPTSPTPADGGSAR